MKNDFLSGSKKFYAAAIGGVVFLIIAFAVGGVAASAATFKNFSSEFYIAGVDVSGKTVPEAEKLVEQRVTQLSHGVTVDIPGLGSHVIEVGSNMIDINETLASARRTDERGVLTKRLRDWLGFAQRTDVSFVLADDAPRVVSQDLIANWHLALSNPVNAKFEISSAGVSVAPAINGQTIDREQLSDRFIQALEHGDNRISASIIEQSPEITTETAESLRPAAAALAGEITKGRILKIKDKTYSVTAADLTALLQPRMNGESARIGIDADILKTLLGSKLAAFEQEPKNAAFEYQGNRVTKFQAPQTGVAIDWDKLAQDLFASLSTNENSVVVATKDTEPEIPLEKTNNLGIKEIIGFGTSDFSGSTSNRIHNIETGMHAINGILIAPGEEFSLIKTLGAIDGSTGYVQELVIKENKTQPEFGGGLCQIGTTTFRAAMGAGFPILERRNHSYQVHYYFENGVSGTDATIYDPKPDFRFKNDTANWVMLQTIISKPDHKLEFRFWGTKDGRTASRTIPKTLATQPAPPKQEIQTTDLPPGKVKCTEKAHAGATMLFTYTVAYADGTVKKEDFQSFYKPWAEVCLVGVAATSTPTGSPSPAANTPTTISPDAAGVTGN